MYIYISILSVKLCTYFYLGVVSGTQKNAWGILVLSTFFILQMFWGTKRASLNGIGVNPQRPQRTWRCRRYRFSSCTAARVASGIVSYDLWADGMGKQMAGSWSEKAYKSPAGSTKWMFPKIGVVKPPKLDGLFHGKPYQNAWFGGPTPIFGNTQILHHWLNFEKGLEGCDSSNPQDGELATHFVLLLVKLPMIFSSMNPIQ